MKISLSNLFSVMAASSFVSSANALSLNDYAASSIGPETNLTSACNIGAVTAGGAELECGFVYANRNDNNMTGSFIVADLYSEECSDSVGEAAVAVDHEDKTTGVGVVKTKIAMDTFDATNGDKNDKNTGTIVQKYCARADVWDDVADNQASGSVLSYMMTVTTTITFDQEGDFTVDVTTTEFAADAATAAAERQVGVSSAFGDCSDTPAGASAVAVGSVLKICVSIASEDTDVKIDTIRDVTIKDAADDNLLTTPISNTGGINYVTSLEPNVNEENAASKSKVMISTLMIPKIYDELSDGSSSFDIAGIVEFKYIGSADHFVFFQQGFCVASNNFNYASYVIQGLYSSTVTVEEAKKKCAEYCFEKTPTEKLSFLRGISTKKQFGECNCHFEPGSGLPGLKPGSGSGPIGFGKTTWGHDACYTHAYGERRLQTESAPFSLKVDLTKNDLPQVAMNKEESGSMSAGVGMMALAAGVAALL